MASNPDNLRRTLLAMVTAMPSGSAVTLPVDWLRDQLDSGSPPADAITFEPDLTVDEVASKLHRRPSTVRNWCQQGRLEAYRLHGREWRISPAALVAYQQRQRREATAPPKSARRKPVRLGQWRDEAAA